MNYLKNTKNSKKQNNIYLFLKMFFILIYNKIIFTLYKV